MASCPRGEIVRDGEVAVYHVWSRTVRKIALCGKDPNTGKDFEYRRVWIRQFEERLAGLFGVEVASRAELSNHIHLILRTRPDVVKQWTDEEVARRWLTITHLTASKDGQTIKELSDAQIAMETADPLRVVELRRRLASISYFMASLCQHISRRSNREDGCKGHFWESRFKCRELLDEAAILACSIYVDLNQIRAQEAISPETSTHTSAYDRIVARRQRQGAAARGVALPADQEVDGWMCPLTLDKAPAEDKTPAGELRVATDTPRRRASDKGLFDFEADVYLQLLDSSGRMIREGKSGAIPENLAPILTRLGVSVPLWGDLITHFEQWFGQVVGKAQAVSQRAALAGRRWYRGCRRCAELFG